MAKKTVPQNKKEPAPAAPEAPKAAGHTHEKIVSAPAAPRFDRNYKSTADIPVPEQIIDQVVGQEEAVLLIRKAAKQRRHVLLIGEPGTGKSMLGLAMAELLPKEKLVDIVSFPNLDDEQQPIIKTVPAGQGREIVMKGKLQANDFFKNQSVVMLILAVIAMVMPWWILHKYESDVMFAAFFLGGMMFLGIAVLFISMNRKPNTRVSTPKVIVDNYNRKQAPFHDATGAHAGALLGDVLHDPFQLAIDTSKFICSPLFKGLKSGFVYSQYK